MADRHRLVYSTVVMANADQRYEVAVPKDARDLLIKMRTTADKYVASGNWRWSNAASDDVAAGAGCPMLTGEDVGINGPLTQTTIYVAHGDVASATAHIVYALPARP